MTNVGIETRLLRNPRTGIGNYSLQILQAVLSTCDDITYRGFTLNPPASGLWQQIDLDWLKKIEAEPRSSTNRKVSISGLSRFARRFDFARRMYRSGKGTIFAHSMKTQRIDLFHALNFIPPGKVGVPVLPTIYDLSFLRYPETHPAERREWLKRLPAVVENAPFILTISEFSRQEISTTFNYPLQRIIVAPPAAASIFQRQGATAVKNDIDALGLQPDRFFFTVGTLEPRKNLKTLIEAYGQISKTKRETFPLIVAGTSGWGDLNLPYKSKLLIEEGSLRFCGSISDQLLRSLYEGARALLFPSIYEGFGMPIVEAMSCGTPVMHSDKTAMDEISGNLGIKVPAMDVDAWTCKLNEMSDPDWVHQFSADQLIAQSKTFDWKSSAVNVLTLYSKFR